MKWYLQVLKKYAVFNGRARRSEYWYFLLLNILILIAFMLADAFLNTAFLDIVYIFAILLPGIAVAVRRMHDVNKSGWYCLIPIYNIILACTEGTSGHNDYGNDPKGPDFTFEFEQPQTQAS